MRAGRLVLDGTLRADAPFGDGVSCRTFAAGGAVALTVGVFEGAGELSARGGGSSACPSFTDGPPGAGGLVLVATATASFRGHIFVEGGTTGGSQVAEPGTALLVHPDGGVRVLAGTYLLRGAEVLSSLALDPGATVTLAGPATIQAPLGIIPGAKLRLVSPHALAGIALVPLVQGRVDVEADLDAPDVDLELGEGARLVVNRRLSLRTLDIRLGAVVTSAWGVTTMALVARRAVRVHPGGRVDVSGCGLEPTKSIDPLAGAVVLGSSSYNGGSHGGRGGLYDARGHVAPVYDTPEAPRFPGGGGGCQHESPANPATNPGAAGGGVLRLAAPLVHVDGALLSDGLASSGNNECGSGAGGSLVVEAGTLSGSGTIAARGGSARSSGVLGGGGGGLVRLVYGQLTFDGGISAAGAPAQAPGERGHVTQSQRDVAPVIVSRPPSEAPLGRPQRSLMEASGAGPFSWALVAGPAGAAVDASTGLLSWTPEALGRVDFAIAVEGPLGRDEQAFAVEVVDSASIEGGVRAPRFLSTPDTAGRCGVPYRYSGAGAPAMEGTPPFTFAVEPLLGVPLPPELRVDAATGALLWTPSRADVGGHPLRLSSRNDAGVARQDFAVVVACPEPTAFASSCGCGAPGAQALSSSHSGLLALLLAAALGVGRRVISARRPPRG